MMFPSKAQKLFVESVSLDLRSVYFYPISRQKMFVFVSILGSMRRSRFFLPIYVVFLQKKNPLHVHEDVCIGFFRLEYGVLLFLQNRLTSKINA